MTESIGEVLFVQVLMLLGHMVADYTLQGWLAQGKQKEWWEKNAPSQLYKNDYKCALLCHSFYWAAVTFLPMLLLGDGLEAAKGAYVWAVLANTPLHYMVDDLKANKKWISLWTDQSLHFLQIGVTLGLAAQMVGG